MKNTYLLRTTLAVLVEADTHHALGEARRWCHTLHIVLLFLFLSIHMSNQ